MSLAASVGPGVLGFLVLAAFIVVAVAIFLAMSRSMRRMRSNVDRGEFGRDDRRPGSGRPGDPPA